MRESMITCVLAVNKHLKDKVNKMDTWELLANMHPSERESFSNTAYSNALTKTERINK